MAAAWRDLAQGSVEEECGCVILTWLLFSVETCTGCHLPCVVLGIAEPIVVENEESEVDEGIIIWETVVVAGKEEMTSEE